MSRIHPFEENRMLFLAENGGKDDLKPVFGKVDGIEKFCKKNEMSGEDMYHLEVTYKGHPGYLESFICDSLEERDQKYEEWLKYVK